MAKVLVVDDTEDIRVAISDVLLEAGFEVVGAADGIEALAVLERDKISLVVSDVNMPRMDGFELVRAIKRRYSRMPVIMASSADGQTVRMGAFSFGADDYFVKPFDSEKFIRRVYDLLNYDPAH